MWSQFDRILNRKSLLRMVVGTVFVSAAILVGLRWWIPQFVLPNLWPLAMAFPAIVLLLVAQFGILTLIPPTATIRADGIRVHHGQSATRIDSKSVTAATLTFHDGDRVRLRICYTKGSERRSRTIGVPPTVDFDRLCELLPVALAVRDARNRSRF
ncbi:MAG: hypothetical protein AAF989_11940 [Planctomycetota bacterium]